MSPPKEPRRAGKTFKRGGVWVSHHPVTVDATGRIPSKGGGGVKMIHLQLAFGSEGGGSGGSSVETTEKSTSGSRLDAREVEAVAVALKPLKSPPLARIWMQGRWW